MMLNVRTPSISNRVVIIIFKGRDKHRNSRTTRDRVFFFFSEVNIWMNGVGRQQQIKAFTRADDRSSRTDDSLLLKYFRYNEYTYLPTYGRNT